MTARPKKNAPHFPLFLAIAALLILGTLFTVLRRQESSTITIERFEAFWPPPSPPSLSPEATPAP